MGLFAKLSVHVSVLSRKSLNVFSKFSNFLCLKMCQSSLLLNSLFYFVHFVFQEFDFTFSFKQSFLHIVFFANRDRHLMLHIAKFKWLSF